MKRTITIGLTVIMMMALCCNALADYTANDLQLFYDAAYELFFETSNVTVSGEASFSLNGEHFKTAHIECVQDYDNSLLELKLLTPRRYEPNGPERETGYAVIANGEKIYVMEKYYPGTYKTGSTGVQTTLLRKSVQLCLIADLVKSLMDRADELLGENAISIQANGRQRELKIKVGENVPGIVNSALNVFYQFITKRYFDTDYDTVAEKMMSPMENYLTVTDGILSATRSVALKEAEITSQLYPNGGQEAIDGNISLFLNTAKDGVRELDISFYMLVSDLDGSEVKAFNPQEYQVVPAEGKGPTEEDSTSLEWYENRAKFILGEAGFDRGLMKNVDAQKDDDDVIVTLNSDDNSFFAYCSLNPDGGLREFRNITTPWKEEKTIRERKDITDEMIEEYCKRLNLYMEAVQPGMSNMINGYSLDAIYQEGDQTFLRLTDPFSQAMFIVRIYPSWRIDTLSIPKSNG